jgi:hypothetical protein
MTDAVEAEYDTTVRLVQVSICQACLNGEGWVCHTPGCIFIRMRPPEWKLDENQIQFVEEIKKEPE